MQPPSYIHHRVKVYKLNETGGWDDKGTGLVSMGPLETPQHPSTALGLVVLSEENHKTLLAHRISTEDIYHRQDDTIITWTDPDLQADVALSFQEAAGCNTIWQHIMQVQQHDSHRHPGARRRLVDEFEGVPAHMDGEYHGDGDGIAILELPAPEMGNLEDIAKVLSHVPPLQRERVAQLMLAPHYLRRLLDHFKTAEDLEDKPSLHALFRTMKAAIMLNDTALLEEMLKEEHVMDVMGCLEYDPDLPTQQHHRQFLQTNVVFKEVVPIHNQETLCKIHQTYRIQYLKDVILPRSLDDATYATLASLMLFNNVEVLMALQQDPTFLPKLFDNLKKHKPEDTEWHDLVAFLQELCGLAKHLQPESRRSLFSKLIQLGMFEIITKILQHSTTDVKLRATDILLSAMAHDPLPLRTFLTQQPDNELLGTLIKDFIAGDENGLAEQIAELFKALFDPETMDTPADKNTFLELFYEQTYMDRLVTAVTGERFGSVSAQPTAGTTAAAPAAPAAVANGLDAPQIAAPNVIGLIVDLLCFCVQHHTFRAKYQILRKNVLEKVLKLLRRKERWLAVAGIRFVRTCIGTKDDFYARYLCRSNLLEPIINVFLENGDRYNLLNSAVLEMVEFIRKENIKMLIDHLMENFGDRFDDISYVETFKQLRIKYDQSKERPADAAVDVASTSAATGRTFGRDLGRRRRRDDRELDRDEEDYFSEDAEMAESTPSTEAAAATTAATAAAAPGVPGPQQLVADLPHIHIGPIKTSSSAQQATQRTPTAAATAGQQSSTGNAAAAATAAWTSSSGSPQRPAVAAAASHSPPRVVAGSSPDTALAAAAGDGSSWLSGLAQYGDDEDESDKAATTPQRQQPSAQQGSPQQQQQQQRHSAGGSGGAHNAKAAVQASPEGTLQRAHDENGVSPNRIKRLKLSEKNGSGAPVDVPVQQPAALSQH
eukprot:jgi/Chrzof1/8683/Cz03g20120.t1